MINTLFFHVAENDAMIFECGDFDSEGQLGILVELQSAQFGSINLKLQEGPRYVLGVKYLFQPAFCLNVNLGSAVSSENHY